MIRILVYDGQGFWYMTKRLSKGRFRFWCTRGSTSSVAIAPHQLQTLIAAGNWPTVQAADAFRPLD